MSNVRKRRYSKQRYARVFQYLDDGLFDYKKNIFTSGCVFDCDEDGHLSDDVDLLDFNQIKNNSDYVDFGVHPVSDTGDVGYAVWRRN